MNVIAKLVLILFLGFLCTPTIVCVLKKNTNLSAFYNFSDEVQSQKEIKAIVLFDLIAAPALIQLFTQKSHRPTNFVVLSKIPFKFFIPPKKIRLLG